MKLFKQAALVKPPVKKGKAEKANVNMEGLRQSAELDALIKSLSSIKASVDATLKITAMDYFIEHANGRKPESFRGIDGIASGSFECRKRGTNSPLNEDQVKLLESAGLQVEKQILTNKLYGINPSYAEDSKLLEQVEAALADIVPSDFIVLQEESYKKVVTDSTMEAAYALGDKAPRAILEIVSTLAIKPKLESIDVDQIMKNVRAMIVMEKDVEAE